MRRILVTGSGGFLASHLLRELRREFPSARLCPTSRAPGRGRSACDLLDPKAARALVLRSRPDCVFHLAGLPHAGSPGELRLAHAQTTIHLLEALRVSPESSRAAVIISGSAQEYGPARGGRPLREDAPLSPTNDYGRSKAEQSLLALWYGERFHMDVRIARVFNLVGPGMSPRNALGSFARQVARIEKGLNKPPLKVGDLSSRRDYVDVRDAARALAAVARRGAPGEIYNVCSGTARPARELLDFLLSLADRSIRTEAAPPRRKAGDPSCILGDRSKARAALGWVPRVPIERSVRDTLDWCRHNSIIARK